MRIDLILMVAAVGCTLLAAPVAAEQIYLQADFDDKVIDEPIGTGGPEVGEPIETTGDPTGAMVRSTPMLTPCLQIIDQSDCCAFGVRFEFLSGAEIADGPLVIRADLWIPEEDSRGYDIAVREKEGSARSFLSLHFTVSGRISASDAGGSLGFIGSYETDRVTPVRIAFDMTAGTYDVSVDGVQIVDDEPHGVTGVGIGAVLFRYSNDPGVGDSFYVDNVYVADSDPTPVEPETWGAVKVRFRDTSARP